MKVGDIFYGISVLHPQSIEVNQIKSFTRGPKNELIVNVETIIGDTGSAYSFPIDHGIDAPFIAYYNSISVWIFSKDLKQLIKINEKLLHGSKIKCVITAWDIWRQSWIDLYIALDTCYERPKSHVPNYRERFKIIKTFIKNLKY